MWKVNNNYFHVNVANNDSSPYFLKLNIQRLFGLNGYFKLNPVSPLTTD